jgi:hypothetical protein
VNGEYEEGLTINLAQLMQDSEDNTLYNDDTEADYLKLVALQTGQLPSDVDMQCLASLDASSPLDPDDIAAARYFIPRDWRWDPDVVDRGYDDRTEQQGATQAQRDAFFDKVAMLPSTKDFVSARLGFRTADAERDAEENDH